jgi:O-antigen/teichoic acid export membrane protein
MNNSFSRSLNKLLPRGGLARNASILAGGTALAQIIAIASSPILTRLYKPCDFGALQVFISIMGLALVAATGRYEIALLLPKDEQSAIDVLGVALLCVGFSTALAMGFVILCHYQWMLPASMLVLKEYLWLLPISLLGAGIYQVLSYWAMRHNCYKQIATTKFMQVGAQVGTQLGAGVLIGGSLGLLLGDAVGRILGSERFLRELWRNYDIQLRAIRLSRMMRLAVRYRDYPLVSLWGALINTSGLALPSLFLAQYYGAQETGWFALVNRVLGVPAALIGASIAQVYTSEAAKLSRSDPLRLMNIFLKTTRRMLYLGGIPCLLFTIFAPWIFEIIFGREWRQAGEYARYLTVMFYASFINSPVVMTLNVLERQHAQLVWDISRLALTLLAVVLPHYLGYGASIAILGYGIAMTLMYGIHWTQSYFAIAYRVKTTNVPGTDMART